jgi:hypothetical protein
VLVGDADGLQDRRPRSITYEPERLLGAENVSDSKLLRRKRFRSSVVSPPHTWIGPQGTLAKSQRPIRCAHSMSGL